MTPSCRSPIIRAACTVLVAAVCGCADDIASPAPARPDRGATAVGAPQDAAVQAVARGIAGALAEPALRRQLLEELRDSPLPQHRISLQGYLLGAQGSALASRSAQAAGRDAREFAALLRSLPALELIVPRPTDRVNWTGSGDLAVFGTVGDGRDWAERGWLRGYTPAGDSVALGPFQTPGYVLVMIRPAAASFGIDPVASRGGGDSRSQNSISRREEEFTITPQLSINPVEPYPGLVFTEPADGGYDLQINSDYCRSGEDDADGDAMRDSCEHSLAYAFRPYLRIQGSDVCPAREPYWSATHASSVRGARIFYALSYYHDCGRGSIGGLGGPHYGDSEFIVVLLRNFAGTNIWAVESVTMSAHHGTGSQATRTFPHDDSRLTYPDQRRGAPLVWAALDKHANYPTRDECDAGGYGYDECFFNFSDVRVETLASANIGNSTQNVYPTTRALNTPTRSRAGHPGVESFWTTTFKFCGWQDTSNPTGPGSPWVTYHTCAGPYGSVLRDYGF